jgi:hypothetical protein
VQELPSHLWEQFLADGDSSALLIALRRLPTRKPLQGRDYPECHRICDVQLGGQAYRISRLVDLDDHAERLFIEPTDFPDFTNGGVPFKLRGASLRRWVIEESESPAKGPVDWGEYLGG